MRRKGGKRRRRGEPVASGVWGNSLREETYQTHHQRRGEESKGKTHRTRICEDIDLTPHPSQTLDPSSTHASSHQRLEVRHRPPPNAHLAHPRVCRSSQPSSAVTLFQPLQLTQVLRVLRLDADGEGLDGGHEASELVNVQQRTDGHGPELREYQGGDCTSERERCVSVRSRGEGLAGVEDREKWEGKKRTRFDLALLAHLLVHGQCRDHHARLLGLDFGEEGDELLGEGEFAVSIRRRGQQGRDRKGRRRGRTRGA